MENAPLAIGPRPSASRSQTDLVVEEIKSMIVRGQLRPGARLPIEKDLATLLGVSRSPLREGVRALAMMGVLESRQGDGTYVTSLDASLLLAPLSFLVELQSPEEAGHLASVRRLLEVEAAGRAALHITPQQLEKAHELLDSIAAIVEDPREDQHGLVMDVDIEFHRLIAQAAQNRPLEALVEAFANRTMRDRMWRSLTERGVVSRTHREHHDILRALTEGDPDRARLAMAAHLVKVEDFIAAHPHGD